MVQTNNCFLTFKKELTKILKKEYFNPIIKKKRKWDIKIFFSSLSTLSSTQTKEAYELLKYENKVTTQNTQIIRRIS